MAKKLYYAALIGDNSEIMRSFDKMRVWWLAPYFLVQKTNMNEDVRNQYVAWTLQALGHTLHLIQDASVPAHTRNDLHGPFEPYESWTNQNKEALPYDDENLTPWSNWEQNPTIKVPDVFIDADKLKDSTTPPITGLNQGIAEYSQANFFSADTILDDGESETINSNHNLRGITMNDLGGILFPEEKQFGNKKYNFYYVRNETAQIPHFALCGIPWHLIQMNSGVKYRYANTMQLNFTVDDPEVNKDYAAKLIPRAVGYSAGLLDYFFRGSIDIKLPSKQYHSGIYAMTTDSDQGFTHIVLDARNTTPDGEKMTDGSIELVVKYRLALENPFQSHPVPKTEAFSYIVAREANNIRAISSDEYTELAFDLSPALPIWATDVSINLVYKGNLGAEADGVAVGYKDISEPTPLDVFSNLDKLCLAGNWYDAGSAEAIALVDINGNGISDRNEVDVYPHDLKDFYIRLSSVDDPQYPTGTQDDIYIPGIKAGEYMMVGYFLSDDKLSMAKYNPWSPCTAVNDTHAGAAVDEQVDTYHSVKNQADGVATEECIEMGLEAPCTIIHYPTFNSFRGIKMRGVKITYKNESWGHDNTCSLDDLK
jgi:hypothetical protein